MQQLSIYLLKKYFLIITTTNINLDINYIHYNKLRVINQIPVDFINKSLYFQL
jgi:hypothetical protein